jgi:hypothetical protein
MEIVLIVLAFPFLSSSWSFILACFGRVVGSCGWRVFADIPPLPAWSGVIQQTVIEVSV